MVDVYLSVSDIENYLGTTFDSSTNPTLSQVEKWITMAEEEFERNVGVYREQTNTDELCDGHYYGIKVKNLPLNSITSISKLTGTLFDQTWEVLDSDEYYINDSNIGQIYLKNPIEGEKNYKITYTSGYSYANMPEYIKFLVMLMTFRYLFSETLFETNGNLSGTTEIIDVDVYKSITNGSSPYLGLQALDDRIEKQKSLVKSKLKTYVI